MTDGPVSRNDGGPMDRRRKVELFEKIRREYRFGVGTIQGVAKKLNTHRRMVRQAFSQRQQKWAQLWEQNPAKYRDKPRCATQGNA
jgi:hypothetical protein